MKNSVFQLFELLFELLEGLVTGDPSTLCLAAIGVWLIGLVLCPVIASKKGRNGITALIMAIFLGPIITYLYLLAVPTERERRDASGSAHIDSDGPDFLDV